MPYLSASAVVIHYEEALYQVYAPLPLPLPLQLRRGGKLRTLQKLYRNIVYYKLRRSVQAVLSYRSKPSRHVLRHGSYEWPEVKDDMNSPVMLRPDWPRGQNFGLGLGLASILLTQPRKKWYPMQKYWLYPFFQF